MLWWKLYLLYKEQCYDGGWTIVRIYFTVFNNFMEFIMLEFNWRVNVTLAYGYMKRMLEWLIYWVRLNYATTHHDPPRPTTIHHHPPPPPTTIQNISTTTHNHSPPSTTFPHQPRYIHHPPPPAKIYPSLPTISQKVDHHPAKAKIYSYITSFRHCFNSFFFFQMQCSFSWRRFCVIKVWSARSSNSKFLLHSVQFTIFDIF